ncbi:hypothetical protein VTK56DRAFT_2591 [Thermocarpiscus australiensis]
MQLDHGDELHLSKRRTWTWRFDVLFELMGVMTYVLACVALWSAVTSTADFKTAALLAKWTSIKDLLEHYETVYWAPKVGPNLLLRNGQHAVTAPPCLAAQNITLPPPPGFPIFTRHWGRLVRGRRILEGYDSASRLTAINGASLHTAICRDEFDTSACLAAHNIALAQFPDSKQAEGRVHTRKVRHRSRQRSGPRQDTLHKDILLPAVCPFTSRACP